MINLKNKTRAADDGGKRFQRTRRIVSSVIIAVIVWFVIVNVVNPKITITMMDVPVRFVGEAALRDRGFVVVDKDELPQFTVKVRGTRRDLISAMDRVRVEIDLNGISNLGQITVVPVVSLPDYISLEKQKFSTVELNIEAGYEKTIPIIIRQEGDDKQKSKGNIVSSEAQAEEITITGPKSAINKVHACLVTVDVSKIEQNETTVYVSQLVDDNYNEIDNTSSIYYNSTIQVDNTVYKRHAVPVKIEIDEVLRKKFVVRYDKEAVDKITVDIGVENGTKVPEHIVAVLEDGDWQKGQKSVEMKFEEAEGVYLSRDSLTQTVEFEELDTKKVPVTIELRDLPDNLTADSTKLQVDMKLRVPESMKDDVKAYIDCSKLKAGEQDAKVVFYSKNVTAYDRDTIKVTLKEKETK